MNSTRTLFLATCANVAMALADPRIAEAWNEPSILEEQTIGSVAAHVGRGCWVALDYLDQGTPTGMVDFDSAADYFAKLLDAATPELHEGIRQRGAEGAQAGAEGVLSQLRERIVEMQGRLATEREDRLVTVYGDNVMTLDDYLETRILEQVVHLDDLARSIGAERFSITEGAEALVIACGAEIGRRRFGNTTMVRALFRAPSEPEGSSPFPVL